VILGALTKRAQLPFSVWLPAAIAAPTPVSALVHSSTLVTAGVYLLIRLSIVVSSGVYRQLLLYLSVVTISIAGICASFEIDLKKIIALSTLSQLGVIIIILSRGYNDFAVFHIFTHAIFKAMLFLCAGTIIHGLAGCQDIRSMGLFSSLSPLVRGLTVLASFSLGGLPFLSGFYSKDIILELLYSINVNYFIIWALVISTLLTLLYSLRLIFYSLFNSLLTFSLQFYKEVRGLSLPIIFIGFVVILFGRIVSWLIFPHPIYIFMSVWVKLFNLWLIFFCFLFFLNFYKKVWVRSLTVPIITYLSTMWFLSFIPGVLSLLFLEKLKMYVNYIEQGWNEECLSKGLIGVILDFSVYIVKSQLGFIKGLFFTIIFIFIFFL